MITGCCMLFVIELFCVDSKCDWIESCQKARKKIWIAVIDIIKSYN